MVRGSRAEHRAHGRAEPREMHRVEDRRVLHRLGESVAHLGRRAGWPARRDPSAPRPAGGTRRPGSCPFGVSTPVFPPTAASSMASSVVGTWSQGTPRRYVAATKPARSPVTPPPTDDDRAVPAEALVEQRIGEPRPGRRVTSRPRPAGRSELRRLESGARCASATRSSEMTASRRSGQVPRAQISPQPPQQAGLDVDGTAPGRVPDGERRCRQRITR